MALHPWYALSKALSMTWISAVLKPLVQYVKETGVDALAGCAKAPTPAVVATVAAETKLTTNLMRRFRCTMTLLAHLLPKLTTQVTYRTGRASAVSACPWARSDGQR
jgi:hypothetical protein